MPVRKSNQGGHYMLFVFYQTFVIRYGISLFIFDIRNSLFIFAIPYLYALFEVFFRIAHVFRITIIECY